jgi:putative ABC transport system permease protein
MTSLLAVKLRRDLRATWPRIVAMTIAIAVSLTVFGTVLFAWATTSRETSRAYLGTDPASATIVLDRRVDDRQMAAIVAEARKQPGVIEASGRTQFTSKIRADGRERTNSIQVFVAAPDDPMRIANFEVRAGSWPPPPGEILMGRDSLDLLDLTVGDDVLVTTPGGKPARLRVAGEVYDPSLAPAPQEQIGHGYLSTSSLTRLGDQAVLDQLKIQVADRPGLRTPSRDRATIVTVASDVGEGLRVRRGVAVREVQVPEPYRHPHQGQADALLLSLLAGGAAALLLSTVLVANMLNGLFAQQIPQIGILKAIGARSGSIGRFYLAMTLFVAAAATLVALIPGVLLGRAFVSMILGFLGMQAISLAAPFWTYVVVLTAGLALPPLMALVPVVKTSRTTVRAAIDHRGLGAGTSTTTRLLARLGRIRRLDRGLLMALRNTIRRPARFVLTAGLLASAGILFVAGMSTRSGAAAIPDEAKAKRRWDVEVQLARPVPVEKLSEIVRRAPRVSDVEGWTVAKTGVAGSQQVPVTRTYPDQGHGGVAVTAFPAGSTMVTRPELTEGRWLKPNESNAIVLNQIARINTVPDIRAGDTVQLFLGGRPTDWRVVGIAQERGGGSGGAYVTAEGYARAVRRPPEANVLRIATDRHDEETRAAVADDVSGLLSSASIKVRSAQSVSKQDAASEGHLGPIVLVLLAIAISMGAVGCIGLASTMSTNILERTREFGVLHAIGAQPKSVRRIVVAEGVFLALASCFVAVLPTLGLTAVMGAGLGDLFMYAPLPFRISAPAAVIWIVLVTLGAVLATDSAATRASRLTVREALAYI